jgi:pyruvate/2-oxoglutarate/acetoin dehydrogenase E1 component
VERVTNGAKAINEALHEAMKADERVITFGLGLPDPKGVFGTTLGLQQAFGKERAFDMPAAENGMTGIAVGAALSGLRPVMVHQRLDFFLLAMDQLVNNAAKWHYMFGGKSRVPLTIRLILGRGWGQGPTHSQNLQAWFAHVPGLKVVMPTMPGDAKGLLMEAIFDDNPVIYLEHRWLHMTEGHVPEGDYRLPMCKAAKLREGESVSLVAMSYMTIEALHAADHLAKQGIDCEVIDLRTVSPLDWETVFGSVRKTGRLLCLDTGWANGSVSGEIIARVSMDCWGALKQAPRRLALPDFPSPTSFALTKDYYPGAADIVRVVGEMLGRDVGAAESLRREPHDVPGTWFKGPF